MGKFRVRLESPDRKRDNGEPHYRVTALVADDEDHARKLCEQKERELAAHQYPPDELAELEASEAAALERGEQPSSYVRGRLAVHRQVLPYEIVSIEAVS